MQSTRELDPRLTASEDVIDQLREELRKARNRATVEQAALEQAVAGLYSGTQQMRQRRAAADAHWRAERLFDQLQEAREAVHLLNAIQRQLPPTTPPMLSLVDRDRTPTAA